MKSTLISITLTCFVWCNINGQTPAARKKPYIISIETLSNEKMHGILYKIDSNDLQVLPDKKIRFEYKQRKEPLGDVHPLTFVPQQIRSLQIHRKGSTGAAMGIGALVGLTAGTLVGAITTPKSTCPPNAGVCQALDGLDKLSNSMAGMVIGMGVGALTGWIVGQGKKKRFVINGDRRMYNNIQRILSNKIAN